MLSGTYRLRSCEALDALRNIHVKNLAPRELSGQFHKYFDVASVFISHEHEKYEYEFADLSKLVWVSELQDYAIQYPDWVKIVYVPTAIPRFKDDIKSGVMETELETTIKKIKELNMDLKELSEKSGKS